MLEICHVSYMLTDLQSVRALMRRLSSVSPWRLTRAVPLLVLLQRLDSYAPEPVGEQADDADDTAHILNLLAAMAAIREHYPSVLFVRLLPATLISVCVLDDGVCV